MANRPLFILLADRDLQATRPLRVELRRRGARVLLANSGAQAIRTAELFAPDLVILDDALEDGARDPACTLRAALPRGEIILLGSDSSGTPRGVGLGLLASAPRSVAPETLIEVISRAFPGRLEQPSPSNPEPATILCVDDDVAYLSALSRVLTRHGYRVSSHDDPKDALRTISELVPHLAILDVMMPGIDGRQLADRIRREYDGLIPVVMLTALDTAADRASGYRSGANLYMSKPCDTRELLGAVEYYSGDLEDEERRVVRARFSDAPPDR